MSNTLKKMKSNMTKRMDEDHTTLTTHRDYDFDRRTTDIRRLGHAITHFDKAVTQGMIAMKEIASAFEAVGQAFTELTLGSVNTYSPDAIRDEPAPYPAENEDLSVYNTNPNQSQSGTTTPDGSQQRTHRRHADPNDSFQRGDSANPGNPSNNNSNQQQQPHGGGAASVASTKLTDETNGQVRRLAQLFAEETRRMNEGQPFQSYNAGMHRDVVTRLLPVNEHLKAVEVYRQRRVEALEKYNRHKAEVEKVEKQYARKGKPFCDSKSHKKFTEKRDLARQAYVTARDKFNESFSLLMEVNDHAAAQIIHRYLALNDEYLRQLVASIGRILPAMAEAYPLNQEYTSMQNSMIIEAVANAKTPFAKHYERQQQQQQQEDEEEEEPNDEEEEESGNSPRSSDLESPVTDEKGRLGGGARGKDNGPLMGGDGAVAHEPPHEDEDDDQHEAIHAAGNTSQEPGYVLGQRNRLTTGETNDGGKQPAPLPGQVDY